MVSPWFASPFDFIAHLSGPDRDALLSIGRAAVVELIAYHI